MLENQPFPFCILLLELVNYRKEIALTIYVIESEVRGRERRRGGEKEGGVVKVELVKEKRESQRE